jgi:hypothetical protein
LGTSNSQLKEDINHVQEAWDLLTTVEVSEMLRTRLRVGDCMLSVISLPFSSCCSDSTASFFAKSIPDSHSSTYVPLSSNAPCVKTYNYSDTFSSHRTGL